MEGNNVIIDFANKINDELVTRFLRTSNRSSIHTITLTYQSDINYDLKKTFKRSNSFENYS